MDTLKEKLKTVPTQPGIYQFLNAAGEIIYVGKAKSLKHRISQYFGTHDNRRQLPYLMEEAADFQYTVVDSELESLFLENTLIKRYLPKYNIQLRDDKNYAFITIDYRFQIPQIGYARKFEPKAEASDATTQTYNPKSKIRYFGPYSAAYKIRNTLNLVRRIFPYCSHKEIGNRPCFYYYLHRCPGICIGKITPEEYSLQLDRICTFLSGNYGSIKKELSGEMKTAAAGREFEKAARLRDQLEALQLLDERQNVILPKPVSWDIVSLFSESGYACINLFKVREGKLQDKENFVFEAGALAASETAQQPGDLNGRILQAFLEQYYLETSNFPAVVYTDNIAPDPELISRIIRSRANRTAPVSFPQKGKPRDLAKLGKTNAEEYLKHWLSSQAGHLDAVNTALTELKDRLHLEKLPDRIECYDISNIQGTNAVGSMVVFEKGLPAKGQYRKFKIRGKSTPDDFAMMKEMLSRRLARISASLFPSAENGGTPPAQKDQAKPSWPIPDLIVIDGGKGQLGAAMEVLEASHIPQGRIPVIGLAKRIEEIFFPGQSGPLVLPHDNPGLQMLQRLRDETHRFGITFHRKIRSQQATRSALDDIPGVGPKTKKLLKQKFGTVAQIRAASDEALTAAVSARLAKLIRENL